MNKPEPGQDAEEEFWQKVYNERTVYYENHFGPFPEDILKIGHMFGVWPSGGLFVIPAQQLGKDRWVYTTFGFTNPDMPATTTVEDAQVEKDALGRVVSSSGTLKTKENANLKDGIPGYGYEMLMITRENAQWPLWFMQWSANAEILNDAGLLDHVNQYNGITVQDIKVGENESINVLIAKAQPPLPTGTQLSNGKMEFLIATVITEEEMRWSMDNGREALLKELINAGIGQISDRNRPSVITGAVKNNR
jgi:hypothetical protein